MLFIYEVPEWRWLMQGKAPTLVGLSFVYFSLDLYEIYCASKSLLPYKPIFFKSPVFVEGCFVAPCA